MGKCAMKVDFVAAWAPVRRVMKGRIRRYQTLEEFSRDPQGKLIPPRDKLWKRFERNEYSMGCQIADEDIASVVSKLNFRYYRFHPFPKHKNNCQSMVWKVLTE